MHFAVSAESIGKRFQRYNANLPITFKEALLRGLVFTKPVETFWALRNISFSVAIGSSVGVIGPNGSGKSTLLLLIGGIGQPDEGQLSVNGKIGALLKVGVGFHPDLTGRENVFVSGVVSGLTRRQVSQRLDSIIDFAEAESFIDNRMHTYSSGMRMRLGFAVAIHTDFELLLIDEVLAVGDLAFRRKCLDKITEFQKEGRTIVLVSHDASTIRKFCVEAIWLYQGQMMAYGPAGIVIDDYEAAMSSL